MNKKSILVFGVGELQHSIIERAKRMGLFVVGIDPCSDAVCKDACDAFEVVGGQDYSGTIAVCEKYDIKAIVTAATDKPLVMMARVAEKFGYHFFSVDTAVWSTDKFQMKKRFQEYGVPCAKGRLISSADEVGDMEYPIIVKPRDNSGSRGVKLCRNKQELEVSISEALDVSHLDTVLVEEFIEGREFSVESLHYEGQNEVVQFTEKRTTDFPYNVELGHKQPANLNESEREQIRSIIEQVADAMHFDNCPSHTELKINSKGIFVIETSPRLGGDYITSILTPLSTGINIEDQLLCIATGKPVDIKTGRVEKASAICFFSLPEGKVVAIDEKINEAITWPNVFSFQLNLRKGDEVSKITSSINRYGYFIVSGNTRNDIDNLSDSYNNQTNKLITIV